MSEQIDITPYSKRFDSVCGRARNRAAYSETPERFLAMFHAELSRLRREGMASTLDQAPDWLDPTHLAAEIEALAATRAMRNWGTAKGLCLTRRARHQALAA